MNTTQHRLKTSDFRLLDRIFEMESGWVLDFSNATFCQFFQDEIGINIDDPKYSVEGGSKAKRLRYFLRISNPDITIRVLEALWDYKLSIEALEPNKRQLSIQKYQSELRRIIARLSGKPEEKIEPSVSLDISENLSAELSKQLLNITNLSPQKRGYEYEKSLKQVFDAYGLSGRHSFRITGEQIDGSFQLHNETYLLEAKWQNEKTGAADLHIFQGKLEQKANWSRGLFVSNSGFTDDGLQAFGRAKRFVCMDGFDLFEMFKRRISFSEVVAKKVRLAAETGNIFESVRNLYL